MSTAKSASSKSKPIASFVAGSAFLAGCGYGLYKYSHNQILALANDNPLSVPSNVAQKATRSIGFIDRYYISDIVDSCMPGLVSISTDKHIWIGTLNGKGSGFIISGEGLVVTNCHVALNTDAINVTLSDGRILPAKVYAYDEATDLCILKLPSPGPDDQPYPYLKLGDSSKLRVGEWVIAMGSPLFLDNSVTVGVVSTLNRSSNLLGLSNLKTGLIQTDASINPGNSGGPLINLDGEVIGINTLKIQEDGVSGIGFAIPIDTAKEVIEQLLTQGHVSRINLGIRCFALTPTIISQERELNPSFPDVQNGLFVTKVIPGSPAYMARLKPGDVLLAVDDHPLKTNEDFINFIVKGKIKKFTLTYMRDGETRTQQFVCEEM